jgi:peptide/nickel transport system ATP-binding protein
VLSVRDLRVCLAGRPGTDVVAEIDFDVSPGEVLGIVGESGSGKTTVALALLGYARSGLEIKAGEVLLDDVDVLRLGPAALNRVRGGRIAYVPQDPAAALNPALRVKTQLAETLVTHQGASADVSARMDEVLDEVSLPAQLGYLERFPHQLSGGQQQRVALAMAFACRPQVIVMDEPTTGLDVTTQRRVLETVRALCATYGVAAVHVSHDLAVVADLATQVAVMYAGRIIEHGSTDELFRSPIHPYTRGLLAAAPSIERSSRLRGVEGQPPRPGHRPSGCFFSPRCAFRQEVCEKVPPAIPVGGRRVRCWRAHDVLSSARTDTSILRRDRVKSGVALDLSAVTAGYGAAQVLHDVSFSVEAETCIAVVGESGSGKTTLARTIVGLHRSYQGTITFNGEPLVAGRNGRSKETLQHIRYIFQNPYTSLNPRKSVGEILNLPLEQFFKLSRNEQRQRVGAALHDVSLSSDFASHYPDELSGGERQRVAIARALIAEPKLVVCDEVTSALDVSVQAVIVELLRRLQLERRLTIMFITHNLALVRSIAQTVVVLADGRVVETGTVDDVLGRPRDERTRRLIEDAPAGRAMDTAGGRA